MISKGDQATRVSRRTGTYYTPPDLAFDIASQTLEAFLNSHIDNPLDKSPFPDNLSRNSKRAMLKHLQAIKQRVSEYYIASRAIRSSSINFSVPPNCVNINRTRLISPVSTICFILRCFSTADLQ